MSYTYPKQSDFKYKPIKLHYVKTETDLYNMYKKSSRNPVNKVKYLEVFEIFFVLLLKHLVDNHRAKLPHIGDLYLHYVKRRWGKKLIDLRKLFSKEKVDPYIHFTNKFPKLKWDFRNYRFRNVNFYIFNPAKKTRSTLFHTYIDQ